MATTYDFSQFTTLSYTMPPFTDNTWPCPNCFGMGHMPDGACSIGPSGYNVLKPCTPCWVCKGSGRVYVEAAPRFDKDK